MSEAINIDSSGRMVLPKHLRNQLHIHGASKLDAEVVGGRLQLTPIEDDGAELVQKNGLWVIRSKNAKPQALDAGAAVKADREARIRKLSGAR